MTRPVKPAPAPADSGSVLQLAARFLTEARAPRWIGNLTYLIGFVNILTGSLHRWRLRLHPVTEWVPGAFSDVASAGTVVAGIMLVLLAHSLKRRKVRAWWAAIALLVASVGFHLTHGPGRERAAAVLALLALALLAAYRRQFYALGDPATRWRALWAFFLLVFVSLVVGVLVIAANHRAFTGGWPGLWPAIAYAAEGMVGVGGSLALKVARDRTGDLVDAILLGLGLMTALVTAYLALRAPHRQAPLTADDDARVRDLLARHPDSLGYFTTREDKQVIWSESGKSCIGYRVVNGVMLAAGDPLGDPEAWPGAIKACLTEADRHGWTPAVLGCSELGGTAWTRETGFSALELGDEAIVDTTAFSLEGRSMRNVRQMVNRIRRLGYTTEIMRVRDTSPEVRIHALGDADSWRVGGTERGFSMATSRVLDVRHDPDAIVMLARKDGRVEGMLQFVPWGTDGMSLDLMRRNPKADPGINELLIVDALTQAPSLGITRVSLNFAMFRSTFERGEKLGAGPVLRFWRKLLVLGNRWFQLESLYKFNAKFQPEWYPRFIVYPTTRSLVRVGIAMGEAEAFIVWPRLRRLATGSGR
ncbi:MAG: phosphatidylglycerol lysyltransferase domain-containing protein [Nostocoides sp.]